MRRVLGILCTAAPFVAATLAAVSQRRDFRLAAMAVSATIVSRAATTFTRSGLRAFGTACLSGALIAALVAWVAGARAPFGVIATAVVIAAFAAAGAVLFPLSGGAGPRHTRLQSNDR